MAEPYGFDEKKMENWRTAIGALQDIRESAPAEQAVERGGRMLGRIAVHRNDVDFALLPARNVPVIVSATGVALGERKDGLPDHPFRDLSNYSQNLHIVPAEGNGALRMEPVLRQTIQSRLDVKYLRPTFFRNVSFHGDRLEASDASQLPNRYLVENGQTLALTFDLPQRIFVARHLVFQTEDMFLPLTRENAPGMQIKARHTPAADSVPEHNVIRLPDASEIHLRPGASLELSCRTNSGVTPLLRYRAEGGRHFKVPKIPEIKTEPPPGLWFVNLWTRLGAPPPWAPKPPPPPQPEPTRGLKDELELATANLVELAMQQVKPGPQAASDHSFAMRRRDHSPRLTESREDDRLTVGRTGNASMIVARRDATVTIAGGDVITDLDAGTQPPEKIHNGALILDMPEFTTTTLRFLPPPSPKELVALEHPLNIVARTQRIDRRVEVDLREAPAYLGTPPAIATTTCRTQPPSLVAMIPPAVELSMFPEAWPEKAKPGKPLARLQTSDRLMGLLRDDASRVTGYQSIAKGPVIQLEPGQLLVLVVQDGDKRRSYFLTGGQDYEKTQQNLRRQAQQARLSIARHEPSEPPQLSYLRPTVLTADALATPLAAQKR